MHSASPGAAESAAFLSSRSVPQVHFHRCALRDRVLKSQVTPDWGGSTSARDATINSAGFHIRPRTRQVCEPPWPRSLGWTLILEARTELPAPGAPRSRRVLHVGGGCRRSWFSAAVGVVSITCVNRAWQHKSHRLRRRARFLTCMAALEATLSRVAHWAWNHQLAEAKQKRHQNIFTMLSTPTDAKQLQSVPAITIARVGV